jgi:hypothetical protein
MAYMSQEMKKELAPKVKEICKKYNMKATLGVRHHSTLVLNVKSGPIDFDLQLNNYEQVNVYHIDKHHNGTARKFLEEVNDAMNIGNHDNSDAMVDYFDVGWYTDINIGKWNKPYILTKG